MIYDLNYFIAKFEAIPEERWATYSQLTKTDRRCAFGHCMPAETKYSDVSSGFGHTTDEGHSLRSVFLVIPPIDEYRHTSVAQINNGDHPDYQQPTPKQRILAALYDIKANRAVAEAESIINAEPQTQVA